MSTSEAAYTFAIPKRNKSIIKAIGVGGGGSNAINHMFLQGIKGVEFIACNTDSQALSASAVPYKLQIGAHLTEGLGCGANPEVGRAAALESKEQIKEMLADTKMVFITAGMGGGTGTGAAPVIAKIAKDMDILTVGIVTVPFSFEGKKKQAQAEMGIQEMRKSSDTVLVILNEKLREIYGNLPLGQAFAEADNVLTMAAKGIAEIITLAGHVNVDFQDVRTVMYNAGAAVMGSSETHGENRAVEAAQKALLSPLLDNRDIMGAKRILLSIVSGEAAQLQMDELIQITECIRHQSGDEAEMIFGHGIDPDIGENIRVTIIATDFASLRGGAESLPTATPSERYVLTDPQPASSRPADDSVNHQDPDMILTKRTDDVLADRTPDIPPHRETDLGEDNSESATEDTFSKRNYEFVFQKKTLPDKDVFDPSDEQRRGQVESEETSLEDADNPSSRLHAAEEDMSSAEQEHVAIRQRLRQEAEKRREEAKMHKKKGMSREELNEKWSQPAYLRRGVKLTYLPHSSASHVSRYNLNEDNTISGTNKFLHDNVD